MTLLNKSPMARKEARNYVRRCLAVMLCCVLVFGMTVRVTPRVKAVAAAGLVAAGGWAADAVASTIGFESLIAASGLTLNINQAVQDNILNRGYDFGYALDGAIAAGELSETTVAWMESTVAVFKEKGGIVSGDSFTIPADVAEEIRLWTLSQLDFVDGQLTIDDRVTSVGFVLTQVDAMELEAYVSSKDKRFNLPLEYLGSGVGFPPIDFSSSFSTSISVGYGDLAFLVNYSLQSEGSFSANLRLTPNFQRGNIVATGSTEGLLGGGYKAYSSYEALETQLNEKVNSSERAVLFYSSTQSRVYAGVFYPSLNYVSGVSSNYYSLGDAEAPPVVTTTIKETAATSKPITKDLTVTVPADLPVTDVGGYDIPVFGDITGEELTGEKAGEDTPAKNPGITAGEISQAITDALPITGAAVGDQVVGEAMTEPDSLGAVFISKFPFSIPWDVAKAIQLLAAPPVTPYWEVDFMQPIAGRVGGFRGSTTIVIDFGEYPIVGIATRWTSTLLFVYALAMGTKKLIWTA